MGTICAASNTLPAGIYWKTHWTGRGRRSGFRKNSTPIPMIFSLIPAGDDITDLKSRDQHLLDVSPEDVTVHGAIVDKWRGHSGETQCSGEVRCFPMAMWHAGAATLASNCTPAQTCHLRRKAGFVYKY
jgi:hypothetical protein